MGNDEEFNPLVVIRRNWMDSTHIAQVYLSDLSDFHWTRVGGGEIHGLGRVAPRDFVHAYMSCMSVVAGNIAHSCRHGPLAASG
jgi:hypothetical protein